MEELISPTDWMTSLPAQEIFLYADGSFSVEAQFGAWAFYAPRIGIAGSGTGVGQTSERFELTAIARGLVAVAANDSTNLIIRVITDCTSVIRLIKKLRRAAHSNQDLTLATAGIHEDLLREILPIVKSRRIRACRHNQGDPNHHGCHREALYRLRSALKDDPTLVATVAIRRRQARIDELTIAREKLLTDLGSTETELSVQLNELGLLISSQTSQSASITEPEFRSSSVPRLGAAAAGD